MRDFYRRLNIPRSASLSEAYSAALRCSNASLQSDATFIFNADTRKQAYDNLNDTLIIVGKLRPSLGLSHTDKWDGQIAEEYTIDKKASLLLPDLMQRRRAVEKAAEKQRSGGIGWVFATVIFLLFGWAILTEIGNSSKSYTPSSTTSTSSSSSTNSSSGTTAPRLTPAEEFAHTHSAVPFPDSGTVINLTGGERIAPLEIRTSAGSNYLIKLKHTVGNQDAVNIYVQGGRAVEVNVPLGSYQMFYAAGETWYGDEHLFGPNTTYSKSDSLFNFQDQGYQITGYTVTLYTVAGGNMRTQNIPASAF